MPNPIPNAAAQTAYKIGMSAPAAFDLNAACAGFCYAMGTAADLRARGLVPHVLVIGAEKLSDWLDWDDRSTAIIFADGGGRRRGRSRGRRDRRHRPGGLGQRGRHGERHPRSRPAAPAHCIQEGQAVFRWATTQIAPVALRAVELAGLDPADIDVFVAAPGQPAHRRGDRQAAAKKGARQDMVVADDIVHSGNTSSASIPMALDHLRAAGRPRSGDVVLLVGFGAGLSYAAQVVVLP